MSKNDPDPIPASAFERSVPAKGGAASSGVRSTTWPGLADRTDIVRCERSTGHPRYRFTLLVEVVNFPLLRRHLGLAGIVELLVEVAGRIGRSVPGARMATIGRSTIEVVFEGELFTDVEAAIVGIRSGLAEPLQIGAESYVVALLMGGAAVAAPEVDEVRLLEAAEAALDEAVARSTDILTDLADPRSDHDPMALMRELPSAVEDGQIFLQYQPKVHVRQQKIASAEALVRWRHPTRGLILPGDFIEIAERSNAIAALTLWTIRQVIRDQRAMAEIGHDFPIFINISGVLLSDQQFVADASELVRDGNAKIGFEITETAVIRDPESAIANLKLFADIGIALAIDDYGAGLSSLAYLKRLPASELKIDKLFVTQLTSSNRDPLIVRSTIDLAHALDMEVTAEGVETPAALALLGVMGCDMVQGYLISRPIEFEAFRRFVEEEGHVQSMASPRLSFRRSEGLWKTG